MSDARDVARRLGSFALTHLAELDQQYATAAADFKPMALEAAQAEAEHKNRRAQLVLKLRDSGEVRSQAEADARADGDPEICGLLTARLCSRAIADSHLQYLRSLERRNGNGQTYASTEREIDRMHASGHGGAA